VPQFMYLALLAAGVENRCRPAAVTLIALIPTARRYHDVWPSISVRSSLRTCIKPKWYCVCCSVFTHCCCLLACLWAHRC
jgi:hypothetical protein